MTFALGVERSVSGQPWRWRRPADPAIGMDALVDELLLARGVAREDLARHREPRIRDFLPDPSCFQDMDKGATRLADAIQKGETVAIFGDYDVDGATSAALLILLLRMLGHEARHYIPDRLLEGYGPSGEALVRLGAEGGRCAAEDFRDGRELGVRLDADHDLVAADQQGRRGGRRRHAVAFMRSPGARRCQSVARWKACAACSSVPSSK